MMPDRRLHLIRLLSRLAFAVSVTSAHAAEAPTSVDSALAAAPSAAPAATDTAAGAGRSPIEFLKEHDAAVQAILTSSDTLSAAQRTQVKEQINAIFDFEELSRLSLGEHWEQRTEPERLKFVEIYRGIIEEQNFDTFEKHYRDGKITYQTEEVTGDEAAVAAILPLERENLPITYLMHRAGDGWRVYDLVIDGTSTAEVNRKAYSRRIAKRSYEWLVERLEKQLAKIQAE